MVADPNYNNQLEYGVNTISATDIEKVRVIALSDTPTCGYAWSLYYLLTNIHLPIVVPTAQRIAPRSVVAVPPKYLYPNPTQDGVHLQNLDFEKIQDVVILNVNGSTRSVRSRLEINGFIDLGHLPSGVYILRISLLDGTTMSEKVAKL